jgi:hypothetical protein
MYTINVLLDQRSSLTYGQENTDIGKVGRRGYLEVFGSWIKSGITIMKFAITNKYFGSYKEQKRFLDFAQNDI